MIAVRALQSRDLAVAADGNKLLLGVDPALPRLVGRSRSSVVGDLEVIGAELSGVVLGYPSDNLIKAGHIYLYLTDQVKESLKIKAELQNRTVAQRMIDDVRSIFGFD